MSGLRGMIHGLAGIFGARRAKHQLTTKPWEAPKQAVKEDAPAPKATDDNVPVQQVQTTPVKKRRLGRRHGKGVQTLRGWLSPFDVFVAHKMGMRKDAIRTLWGEQAAGWATSGGRY